VTHALAHRVQEALSSFLAERSAQLGELGDELGAPVQALRELLTGGKRLRPAFCYWGFRGAGGADCEGIVIAATSLELLQASALLHDDVMDDSDLRRGMPAAHRRFAALHRDSGWSGSADAFGVGAAILLGDLALAWCDEMLRGCGLPDEQVRRAYGVFDAMRTEVIGGQYLDLVVQAEGGRSRGGGDGGSVARAMRVIRFKTAKYSVERPLQLGGALAGARTELLAAYSAFGVPLGEAFQLRDDVLGVFGDPAETGKPAGDDLREGKRTVLVAKALETASPAQRELLDRRIGDRDLDEAGVAALRDVLVETGALKAVETMIDELTAQSRAALDATPLADDEARAALHALALASTQRTV
jgi:geranylgeranyl diphosphate synthase type I